MIDVHPALEAFSPAVREWFATSFPAPTPPQVQGWPHLAAGEHTLICAPTGSGKTLAAFLGAIDRLVTEPPPEERTHRTRVVYVSPLRALAFDIEKNLRSPLIGIGLAAERLGLPHVAPEVAMRTGDTPARDRQRLVRRPPDLLITTPESLYLMVTSRAAETLQGVQTVIVDEIHALAATKRGAHLALTLERLAELTDEPFQRVGLSATQRPLEEVARFLGGFDGPDRPRPVRIVDAGIGKPLEVEVVVPIEDMSRLGEVTTELRSGPATAGLVERRTSIWPSIYPEILARVLAHRSTIIFCNARRAAERLAAKLDELAEEQGIGVDPDTGERTEPLVKAHHGSLAREQRVVIEDQLKRGELRAIVATSSLELGIDMGAVDLVIQVESPGAVSRGLQRIGRAGHQVGEPSRGSIFPKHRSDLVEAAVVTRRMVRGEIETTHYLRNPLDVLAQQIVAHVAARDEVPYDDVAALVRRAANFAELSDDLLANVVDLLAGRYPSEEFSELRPRLVWDRTTGMLRARAGSKRLAVTSGGTIPDRGLFGVFLPDGTRVGELDEEMVYESRAGETFLLGASTWRIEDITFDRVIVTPAPGQPGKMPFWHGDRPGRPLELGRAVGAFVREVRSHEAEPARALLRDEYALDAFAASNVVQYLDEQAEATGVVPDDRTIVVERFRDEIGDWRICVLSPFGTPVHAPWAMAIEQRLSEAFDLPVETMWGDDGIVIRLPESADVLPDDAVIVDPADVEELVVAALPRTALFSSRFRECSARALLLPRRRPDRRTPLWQQRQRAADLLTVAARYPTFPMLLETSRECLQDVFDVPALREVLSDVRSRRIRVVHVDTASASPMASSLLFSWIAAYMYEGDAPLAERRAAALALDRDLLRDLLGAEELRDLLDIEVLDEVEAELQRLTEGRRARDTDEVHDLLRVLGPLSPDEIRLRTDPIVRDHVDGMVETLLAERRAIRVHVAGADRIAAAEDAARLRDALGVAVPVGLPVAFTDPVARPLEELVARDARSHGPFTVAEIAARLGTTPERVRGALDALAADGRVVEGEFRPGGVQREWCDAEVLRRIRRRSLARLRQEVEPVDGDAFARFQLDWHGVREPSHGGDALAEAIGVLAGAPLVASTLERDVLPARVARYRPALLDQWCASGELVWVGAGGIGSSDGRIRLCWADQAPFLLDPPGDDVPDGPLHDAIRSHLDGHGASFWAGLRGAAPGASDPELLAALWDLVWAGVVTNDTLAPLRSVLGGGGARSGAKRGGPRRGRRPGMPSRSGPPAAAGRWTLVDALLAPVPTPTERVRARTLQLVERHGVLTREAVASEAVPGAFSAVYPVLQVLEERGQVRRGYFVAGLGAAQFASPGAVDRLRSHRDDGEHRDDRRDRDGRADRVTVLAATDPAQPYGAVLPWPDTAGRPSRIGAAIVVLGSDGPLVWLDRRSGHLVRFPAAARDDSWAAALAALVDGGRERSVEIRKVDGEALGPTNAEVSDAARAVGFVDGYRGLVRRAARSA